MKIIGNGVYLAVLGYLLFEANRHMEAGQAVPDVVMRLLGYLLTVGVLVVAVVVWIGPPPRGITVRTDRGTLAGAVLMLWTIVALFMSGVRP